MTRPRGEGARGAFPAGTPKAPGMTLTVKLFATFRSGRFDVARMEEPSGATIADVVDELGIPRDEIGILMLRGRHADLSDGLSPGDTVSIFPLVGGG